MINITIVYGMAELWVPISEAAEHYGVSVSTVRRWADSGRVIARRSPTNQRQFRLDEISTIFKPITIERSDYIYVRVSSFKQKDDLERQEDFLLEQFPDHQTIKDIGSGLNFKRKGLLSLLEQVQEGTVREIVVASKDRLCRFGFELIEWLCEQHDTKIVVLEHNDSSPEEEFAAELLDVVQVFCCRRNGRRRYGHKNTKNTPTIKTTPETNTSKVGTS